MSSYYLHDGTKQIGPFSIDDLKSHQLNMETPIWKEGLPQWTTAGKLPELAGIVNFKTPPPFGASATPPTYQNKSVDNSSSYTSNYVPQQPKKSVMKTIFKLIGFLVLIFGTIIIFNVVTRNNSGSSGSYQERVMTVEEIEKSQPTNFLKADGTYNKTFWSDNFKVHGVIKNSATVATFKDAIVRITYYSKTKTVIGTKEYTIYEVFPPRSQVNFELKIANYPDVNTIGWDVIQAKVN